ncbi:MFS transporter [Bacillus timonensis]|nr:MFS transporter [Bacillus timonensis]
MKIWKQSLLLIGGIGVSNLGNWIYLVAINLLVLKLTGSAAAVAGLFVIRPLANLFTNLWAGSYIDRLNKRTMMIITDLIRGGLILLIPFLTSIWEIYAVMFLVNVAGSFFGPTSNTYITKLVPVEKRIRFHSLFGFMNSGAALVGPSVSGLLIMYFSIYVSIYINAISFFLCALVIFFLPNVDEEETASKGKVSLKTIKSDWLAVGQFSKTAKYFVMVYLLFQITTLLGFALDSQEATFIKQVLALDDKDYGFLVSVAGVGFLAGSMAATMLANRLSLRLFIALGMTLMSIGYMSFYLSSTFMIAAASFVVFGFFSAFANAGYATFFQNNVPVHMMGRIGSTANLAQGVVQIAFTLLLGLFAEYFSLQTVCVIFSIIAVIFSLWLYVMIYQPSKLHFYQTSSSQSV